MNEKKWDLKVNDPKSLISIFILIAVSQLAWGQKEKKELSLPEQIQVLKLDSTDIGVILYYSKGYLERGIQITRQLKMQDCSI